MSRKAQKIAKIAVMAIVGATLFIFVGGTVVMKLWNWLGPALFSFKQITFWQAIGLLALCRILVGGFGCHRGRHGQGRHMAEHWQKMSPEEREAMRQRWRGHWGFGGQK